MARPKLTVVRTPSRSLPPPRPLDTLLRLRVETARVDLSADADTSNARHALISLCRSATDFIGKVENDGGELTGDVCFAARVRVTEALRTLLTLSEVASVRDARHTLYCALILVAEALRSDDMDSEKPASRRPNAAPLSEFSSLTLAAARANTKDFGWILDVSQAELVLCTTHRDFRGLDSALARRLSVLQGEIARWNAKGRPEALGSVLVDSIVSILDAPAAAV